MSEELRGKSEELWLRDVCTFPSSLFTFPSRDPDTRLRRIGSYTADTNFSVCKVPVSGYKKVRFPTVLGSNLMCSLFTDSEDNIVETVVVGTLGATFEHGMYIIKDVPEGAEYLYFTIYNAVDFDRVVLSNSDKIEDMEPDWVETDAYLDAVFGSSVVGTKLKSCITGGSTVANFPWTDFHHYSQQRGMQQADWDMHNDIANMFYAFYGRPSRWICPIRRR